MGPWPRPFLLGLCSFFWCTIGTMFLELHNNCILCILNMLLWVKGLKSIWRYSSMCDSYDSVINFLIENVAFIFFKDSTKSEVFIRVFWYTLFPSTFTRVKNLANIDNLRTYEQVLTSFSENLGELFPWPTSVIEVLFSLLWGVGTYCFHRTPIYLVL